MSKNIQNKCMENLQLLHIYNTSFQMRHFQDEGCIFQDIDFEIICFN